MRTASTCERGDSSLHCCGVMLPAGRLVSPPLRGVDAHSVRLRGSDHRPCLRRGWHPLRDSQSRIARLTGPAKIGVNPVCFSPPAEAVTSATIPGVPIICSFRYNRSHVRRPFAVTFPSRTSRTRSIGQLGRRDHRRRDKLAASTATDQETFSCGSASTSPCCAYAIAKAARSRCRACGGRRVLVREARNLWKFRVIRK